PRRRLHRPLRRVVQRKRAGRDLRAPARHPGQPLVDMKEEGTLPADKLVNIGDIASGKAPGRQNDDEIFCYSIGGMPVEDVAWATDVYENALKKGIGTKLNLWDTPRLT